MQAERTAVASALFRAAMQMSAKWRGNQIPFIRVLPGIPARWAGCGIALLTQWNRPSGNPWGKDPTAPAENPHGPSSIQPLRAFERSSQWPI